MRVDRRVQDNGRPVVEIRQRLLHREVRAFEVRIHDRIEVFFAHLTQGIEDDQPCVNKEDIDLAEGTFRSFEETVQIV